MLNPIEINFKLDKTIKRAHSTEMLIKSHDINVIEFHISFDGLELTADHTVKVLSVFNDTKSQTNINCDIVDGKAIYRPDTSIISQHEYAQNYVYVYHGDQSLDVRLFTYAVDSSEIDKTAIKVKTVYDQTYAELLTEFEARLQDYKDSLPQASDLRAEVDVILNKFKVDSQAKLSQYDTDAQQVIADNQTAFGVAESGRQDSYDQAEIDRNQASNQAVVDWNLTADALLETVESNESARVGAETTRKTAETDRVSSESTRKTNETTRISNEDARKSDEVIRLASEVDRVNAENVRSDFYDGFDGRLGDLESDRVILRNLVTNGDFSNGTTGWLAGDTITVESGVLQHQSFSTTGTRTVIQKISSSNLAGHQLYVNTKSKRHSDDTTSVRLYTYNGVASSNATIITGKKGVWNNVSSIITPPSSGSELLLYIGSTNINSGGLIEYDDILVIDLTSTFGAGNEPSKEWMDRLIEKTGYFDEHILNENWQVGEMLRLNSTKANKVQEGWITPTLLNGATGTVQYRKNEFGRVEFRGHVSATNDVTIFVLPTNYRPNDFVRALLILPDEPLAHRKIQIASVGNVALFQPNGISKVSFDNFSFVAGG